MKITALVVAAACAAAPIAASADQRPYAHRHVTTYQQPHYYVHQPRKSHVRQESRAGVTTAQALGGLLILGLIANVYSNKN